MVKGGKILHALDENSPSLKQMVKIKKMKKRRGELTIRKEEMPSNTRRETESGKKKTNSTESIRKHTTNSFS